MCKFRVLSFYSINFLLSSLYFRRQLLDLACDKWPLVSDEGRQGMARMAAAAAWGLGNWESMEEYSCLILRDSYDGAFYRAVLAVHQDHFGQAQQVEYYTPFQ